LLGRRPCDFAAGKSRQGTTVRRLRNLARNVLALTIAVKKNNFAGTSITVLPERCCEFGGLLNS
jgi:hypothetical protein